MLFGEYLVFASKGQITKEDVKRALDIQKQSDDHRKIGSIIVEMQLLARQELAQILLDFNQNQSDIMLKEIEEEGHNLKNIPATITDLDLLALETTIMKFGEYLVQQSKGTVTSEHITEALDLQQTKCQGKKIGSILVEMNVLSRENLCHHLVAYNKYKRTQFIQTMYHEGLIEN